MTDMKNQEQVSIIVPAYNASKTIARCIDSILNQTYSNIQLIIVDDGSSDNTADICKLYLNGENNITYIAQDNKGVSSARNTGLKYVEGQYVFFVDSDDYILSQFIEHFMDYPKEYPYVAGGYTDSNGWTMVTEELVISKKDYIENCSTYYSKVPKVHAAGNRYLMSIITENNLLFEEGCNIGEDSRFNTAYFDHIDTICVSANHEYIYTISENSLVNSFHAERLEAEREEARQIEKMFEYNEFCDQIKYIHWHTTLEHYYSYKKNEAIKKAASIGLKKAINDQYFRTGLSYMLRNGTTDMKIEAISLMLHSYTLYKALLWMVLRLRKKIKGK